MNSARIDVSDNFSVTLPSGAIWTPNLLVRSISTNASVVADAFVCVLAVSFNWWGLVRTGALFPLRARTRMNARRRL